MKSLLLLEDDTRLGKTMVREFEERGYRVTWCTSLLDLPAKKFQYAIVDMRLTGESGQDAIRPIKLNSPDCKVVVYSGYGSINSAVEALKKGAIDFVTKPASIETLELALQGKRSTPEETFKTPSITEMEREYIDFVLEKNEGNISRAARSLGIHRQSLQRKLRKLT